MPSTARAREAGRASRGAVGLVRCGPVASIASRASRYCAESARVWRSTASGLWSLATLKASSTFLSEAASRSHKSRYLHDRRFTQHPGTRPLQREGIASAHARISHDHPTRAEARVVGRPEEVLTFGRSCTSYRGRDCNAIGAISRTGHSSIATRAAASCAAPGRARDTGWPGGRRIVATSLAGQYSGKGSLACGTPWGRRDHDCNALAVDLANPVQRRRCCRHRQGWWPWSSCRAPRERETRARILR